MNCKIVAVFLTRITMNGILKRTAVLTYAEQNYHCKPWQQAKK